MGDDDSAFSCGFGLKTEDADHARSAHSGRSRRTRNADDNRARSVVAVNQGYGLPIAAQKVAIIHVDQRKLGRIVLYLQGNGSNIRASVQHHRNLEGGACGYRAGLRSKREAD